MPPSSVSPAQAAVASASIIGRFQGIEQFDKRTIAFGTPFTTQYQPFNLNRPLESILIVWKGRVTVSVGAYADLGAEAPQNLLQRIRLEGQHATYGNIVPIDISGATAFAYPFMTQENSGNEIYISKAGGAFTLQNPPTVPATGSFDGTIATHDMLLIWNVVLPPSFGIGSEAKRWLNSFLYMPGDWGDRLRLSLTWGDKSALGDPTGATVAFSAFQSATGDPEVSVHLNYSILGPLADAAAGNSGIVVRNEQMFTTFTALATATQIAQLQKRITTGVLIKSGLLELTAQTAGVSTFEDMSDLMLERTQIAVDNKMIRQATVNLAERARLNRMFDSRPIQGYHMLSFIDGQNPLLSYRADGLAAGALFQLLSDVTSAAAGNRLTVTQEQIIGGPFPPLRP